MKPKFYITTPIYYVNDKPHLGSAYTTVNSDVLHRYHKWLGFESLFLTGLDEHGQKVQKAAQARGLDPQQHCDQMAQQFQSTWKKLNIDCDIFFRTTHPQHKHAVQQCLQQLFDKGDIYESTYEGWYCVADESFHTEKELVNGLSPTGRKVEKIVEKNYFFKMSKYQERLIDFYHQNPKSVQPEHRRNEVLGFLKQPLQDLCISRPKSRLQWGIELPFDSNYVTYVWFDALLNYATAIDLQSTLQTRNTATRHTAAGNSPANNDTASDASAHYNISSNSPTHNTAAGETSQFRLGDFNAWWSVAHHLVGKDILMTHAVYWPCMLMALGLPPARVVFAHGWLLNKQNEKMSKSKGDVMQPKVLIDLIGVDALRYYLVKNINFGQDSPLSIPLVVDTVNNDLANTLGNLLSRVSKLVHKYFDGKMPALQTNSRPAPNQLPAQVPAPSPAQVLAQSSTQASVQNASPQSETQSSEGVLDDEQHLRQQALRLAGDVKNNIINLRPHIAVGQIIQVLELANPYIENRAPWKLARSDQAAAGHVLATVLEVLRIAGLLLQPVMPEKSAELLCRLSVTDLSFEGASKWAQIAPGSAILEGPALFPRVHTP